MNEIRTEFAGQPFETLVIQSETFRLEVAADTAPDDDVACFELGKTHGSERFYFDRAATEALVAHLTKILERTA